MNEVQSNTTGSTADRAAPGGANGTGQANGKDVPPHIRRAEEIVDQAAERVAQFTSAAGRAVLRWTARMREEAEDIWAEAQVVRRGKKP